jgi:hypothetical protein
MEVPVPEDPSALHVVGVTGTGRLVHTIRTPGAWTPFVDVFGASAANQPQLQGRVTEVAAARAVNILGGAAGDPATPTFPEALVVAVLVSTQPSPLLFYRYADTGQWLAMGNATGIVGANRIAAACANSFPSVFGGPTFQPTARLHLAWNGFGGQLLVTSLPVVAPAVGGQIIDIENTTGLSRGAFRVPALAGINGNATFTQARLAGLTADGRMYRSLVTSTGGAQVLDDVEAAGAGEAGDVVDVALAFANISNGIEYYGAVTGDGRILLATYNPNSNAWTTWRNLEEADFVLVGPPGVMVTYRDIAEFGTFQRMALATTTEGLHVLGVTTNGQLFHQLQAGLAVQPSTGQQFRDVEMVGVGADAGEFTCVAAA